MMQGEEDHEFVPGLWEEFALAAVAPLGPFTQVHLAPKIPAALLSHAVLTYCSLQSDELILALIDRGGREPGGCCALTTRRIYWEKTDDSGQRGLKKAGGRANGQGPVAFVARYGALPEIIPDSRGRDGSVLLELGGGRAIALTGVDERLGSALARFLERMSTADRRGTLPPVAELDPDLAARIRRVLPAVAQLTARSRDLSRELIQFRSALQSATKRPLATPFFILACVTVFAVMVTFGVPFLTPSATQLQAWGANDGSRIVLRGEYWRLFTSVFIHGGLIHLAVNMWSLMVIGPLVERLYGNLAFAIIYLASGLGGAIASVAASPVRIGVGASGAICGVLGALMAFLITHRRSIPASLLKSLGANVLGIIVFMVVLGRIVPNIDQEAHYGGLATGFLCGLLLYRPWPVARSLFVGVRRAAVSLVIAAALAAAALGMTRRATAMMPPANRLWEVGVDLGPALDELAAIGNAAPSTLELKRDRDDPEAKQSHIQAIEHLAARAALNLTRLRHITTPYPALDNMTKALILAQTSQIAGLDAVRRYLDTGNLSDLSGKDGLLELKTATNRALESFQQQHIEYQRANNLRAAPPQ
jgi:rhomboid protease GluP